MLIRKYKVVAEGHTMDAEIACADYAYDAMNHYEQFIKSGLYYRVYIVDLETGELYNTYDFEYESGGVKMTVWAKM